MTLPVPDHLVFVDFENVPEANLDLIAQHSAHVTLLLGKNQKKLELPLVRQIQRFADRVRLIEVGATGHNALDLILVYHLGRSIQAAPQTKFFIVSKDTDFDPLLAHVRASGVMASRHASFASLPFLPQPRKPAAASPKTTEDRCTKLIARLADPMSLNRPSTEKALQAHIKAALGKEASDASIELVIGKLTAKHGLRIDSVTRKIAYEPCNPADRTAGPSARQVPEEGS